jgi:hypothetical protein
MYWTAPELLRQDQLTFNGTPKGDIYSFAMIMRELIYSSEVGPYNDIQLEPQGALLIHSRRSSPQITPK